MNKVSLALRHLWKTRSIALINVIGLTIGISACMILYSIVSYEYSFDRSLPGKERIYRVYSEFSGAFNSVNRGVPSGFYTWVNDQSTGYESVTHFQLFTSKVKVPRSGEVPNDLGNNRNCILARPDYFQVFSHYNWLFGDPEQSLASPYQVVLTRNRAEVYFGELPVEDYIGQQVIYRDSMEFTVSGIVDDIPFNSDLYFTDFLSYSTTDQANENFRQYQEDWSSINSSSQLFVKVFADTSPELLQVIADSLGAQYMARQGEGASWILNAKVQDFSDMHFNKITGIFDSSRSITSISTLRTMGLIAILILIVASINFINLETAQAGTRSKEVGIRKILGSSRPELILQFLMETFILSLISVIAAIGISALSTSWFTEFTPEGFEFTLNKELFIFLGGVLILLPIMSGLYPSILIAGVQPINALKNKMGLEGQFSNSSLVRRILSLFQFSFAQVLIILTIIIGWQIDYMLNKDLGFRSDDILTIYTPYRESEDKKTTLMNELRELSFVDAISMHMSPPSSPNSSSSVMSFELNGNEKKVNVQRKGADSTYLDFYGIELLAGENITSTASSGYIINETLMSEMGFETPLDAIGASINGENSVRGVVADFHMQSLKSPIKPMVISIYEPNYMGTIGIKLSGYSDPAQLEEWMATIEASWKNIYPDHTFDPVFLDESLQQFYSAEMRTVKLSRIATVVAIIVSCLGLFGLFTFNVMRRTKEIGIRKVLGASVFQILKVLTGNIFLLILISLIVSVPAGYYFGEIWLEEFEYRIPIDPLIFVITGLTTALTALLTVGLKSVKAAKTDPVESLRYE